MKPGPPFVDNDSVQFFYPPMSAYNGTDPVSFTSIVIDHSDFKWLNSNVGIFRFDGKNWVYYNASNMPVDVTKYLSNGLFCDSHGTIYEALSPFSNEPDLKPTLIQFSDNVWKSYYLPFPAVSMTIDKANDNLYFQSFSGLSGVIYKYNGIGSFSDSASFTKINLGGDYQINGFQVSQDSLLVFFDQVSQGLKTDSGHCGVMVQSGDGSRSIYNYADSMNEIYLTGIFGNDRKSIFMIGGKPGWGILFYDSLYILNGANWQAISLNLPGGYNWPGIMKYSNDGVFWFTYGWSGLVKYEHQHFIYHNLSDSKPYSHIADFAFDSSNVKWLACWEGLVRYVVP